MTGGAGFIGSNLVRALLERGDTVRVLDNFSTGNRGNLAEIAGEIEVIEGELRSYERVHNATRGSDVVFHIRALPSVPRSVQDPLTTSAVTIGGTLNVLLAARDEGRPRGLRLVVVCTASGPPPSNRAAGRSPLCRRSSRPSATVSHYGLEPRLRPSTSSARGDDLAVRRRRTALHRASVPAPVPIYGDERSHRYVAASSRATSSP